MTITEAVQIVNKRRIEAFCGIANGYLPEEEQRMQTELDRIKTEDPFNNMVLVGCELLKLLPSQAAFESTLAVAFRFGMDVGRLLQRANAGDPQPTNDRSEEPQPEISIGHK